MGLVGLLMAYYGGLWGILSGLTKSTDHPSRDPSLIRGRNRKGYPVFRVLFGCGCLQRLPLPNWSVGGQMVC